MPQIAFLTLFLGLASGPQPVELSVSGPVAAVELRLDGRAVGRAERPPWRLAVDFGPALLPHELEARAVDGAGGEVARTRQWVNLPRPPAEVELVLENEGDRPAAVRIAWQSLVPSEPEVQLTLDGKPLRVSQRRAELPRFVPDTYHVLTAELHFAHGVTARRDVVLGGLGSVVSTELTAVPILRGLGSRHSLDPGELQGRLLAAGRPLTVKAVENAPEQLLVVRDLGSREALQRLGAVGRGYRDSAGRPYKDANYLRYDLTLEREARVRLVWPLARSIAGTSLPTHLFDSSRDFTARDGGLHWLLTQVVHPEERQGEQAGQRFTDAVAVAGLQALAGNRRRAVLLILGEDSHDTSSYTPAVVRRYLEAIRVPLYVWSLAEDPARARAAWGEVTDVSSLSKLRSAFARLRADLERQSIAWVDGLVLPQEIALAPGAPGSGELSLAGAGAGATLTSR